MRGEASTLPSARRSSAVATRRSATAPQPSGHRRSAIRLGDGGHDAVPRALGDGIYRALRGFDPPSTGPILSYKIASARRLLDSRGAALCHEIND